jgi:hypothetical protein
MECYIVFRHADLSMVILKDRQGRGSEEAVVSFSWELERVAGNAIIEVVAHKNRIKKEHVAKKEDVTKDTFPVEKDA